MTDNARASGKISFVVLLLLVVVLAAGGFFALKKLGTSGGSTQELKVVRKKIPQPPPSAGNEQRPVIVQKKIPSTDAAATQASSSEGPSMTDTETAALQKPTAPAPSVQPSAGSAAAPDATGGREPIMTPAAEAVPSADTGKSTAAAGKTPLAGQPDTAPAMKKSAELPDKPVGTHPYSILVSSCRKMDSVRHVMSSYRRLGLEPYFVKVELKPGEFWWRIFVGHYRNGEEANQIKKDLRLVEALVKKTPYANLIEVFAKQTEAKKMESTIEKLDYSPYLLQYAPDRYGLLVGAFETRQSAEKQAQTLLAQGIPSRVIER